MDKYTTLKSSTFENSKYSVSWMVCLYLSVSWSSSRCFEWSIFVSVCPGLPQSVLDGLSLSQFILVCLKVSWMVHLISIYPIPPQGVLDSVSLSQPVLVCLKVSWMVYHCFNLSWSALECLGWSIFISIYPGSASKCLERPIFVSVCPGPQSVLNGLSLSWSILVCLELYWMVYLCLCLSWSA